MYLQCVLISRNKTKADEEIERIKNNSGKSLAQVYQSKEYLENVRANNTYIDSGLSQLSSKLIHNFKEEVSKHKIDIVLVSPLYSDLLTCYDLFGGRETIQIIIDPSLVPRVNSFANVAVANANLLHKFKKSPSTKLVQHDPHWYATYGNVEVKDSEQVLEECLQQMRINKNYETLDHYHQRLGNFKKGLLKHMAKQSVKLAIISNFQVLEALTSTGLHENFTLINSISFKFGEAKSQFILVQSQISVEMQNPYTSFCCS